MQFFPQLKANLDQLAAQAPDLAADRDALIQQLADYILKRKQADQPVQLIMICTHNSRRSHITQLLAQAASEYHNVSNVFTYSGGTEATAFHPNTVRALQKLGMQIEDLSGPAGDVGPVPGAANQANVHYQVRFGPEHTGLECYSKKFDEPPNPRSEFAAVMTCSDADQNCPVVFGCDVRIAMTYTDPKLADGTPEQDSVYYERALQIGAEMMQVFSRVQQALS